MINDTKLILCNVHSPVFGSRVNDLDHMKNACTCMLHVFTCTCICVHVHACVYMYMMFAHVHACSTMYVSLVCSQNRYVR